MGDTALQLGIVGAYMLVALAVGVVAYRLTDRSAEDYYLASRTLGTVVLLFTTFATLLSAFTFFGGPNLAFAAGPEWILVMGLMDGIIFAVLWYVIGYKQWLVGKRHGYVTLGEMLGDRFGSTPLRVLVAGVSLVWLFPYVMLQQKGAGQAIVGLTNGAVPFWVGAGGITLFMIAYVAISGMRGVAWTDTIQGLFMLSLVWLAVAWLLTDIGGAGLATEQMGAANGEFLALGGGLYTPQFIISSAVSIAFGVTMFPQINQRFFAAGSKKVLKRTFALWPVLVLLLFVPAFMLGAWAVGLGIEVPQGSNVVPVLLGEFAPTWFAALVIAGAMAAMMSSSDSMLLSGSSYLTRDVYRPLKRVFGSERGTADEDRREALVARVGVVVFATLSFVASLYSPGTLVQIGDTAFSGFAQLTVPVALALYWSGTTRYGMYAGVVGTQVFYVLHVFPVVETVAGLLGLTVALPGTYMGWTPGVVGILLGLVLTVGVSLVTNAAPDENRSAYVVEGVEAD
ncbi:sodium:solute symporter [Halomicroarcula sp. GCM10025324]|uniref:sodium:solute symporter family protein n=1 Tax=Haloarcula TaxID=2237 RepID=UPI0023E759E3|nr:sodium:solute symporter family protein [Halomicroarcula sp. ZS-22-S1]